jgi:hypothetical protein
MDYLRLFAECKNSGMPEPVFCLKKPVFGKVILRYVTVVAIGYGMV